MTDLSLLGIVGILCIGGLLMLAGDTLTRVTAALGTVLILAGLLYAASLVS